MPVVRSTMEWAGSRILLWSLPFRSAAGRLDRRLGSLPRVARARPACFQIRAPRLVFRSLGGSPRGYSESSRGLDLRRGHRCTDASKQAAPTRVQPGGVAGSRPVAEDGDSLRWEPAGEDGGAVAAIEPAAVRALRQRPQRVRVAGFRERQINPSGRRRQHHRGDLAGLCEGAGARRRRTSVRGGRGEDGIGTSRDDPSARRPVVQS